MHSRAHVKRAKAQAKARQRRQFGMLLSSIARGGRAGSAPATRRRRGVRCALLVLAPVVLVLLATRGARVSRGGGVGPGKTAAGKGAVRYDSGGTRGKYWRGDAGRDGGDDAEKKSDGGGSGEDAVVERGDSSQPQSALALATNSSRPFVYIGDIDPAKPRPWPKDEKDWWSLHETLVERVKASDKMSPHVTASSRPQLVFYGDSITEGWEGTSFGNVPGPHRMWTDGEDGKIRDVFARHFGEKSEWHELALKPPLVLGISGSRTYDFIWRLEDGEFPRSQLLSDDDGGETGEGGEGQAEEDGDQDAGGVDSAFRADKLERVYIVLMGTNNLGGGQLPGETLTGMDAAARAILSLHNETFAPGTPAAMVFSSLLPRRDDFRARKMCPPRCKDLEKKIPYESFGPAIDKVNRALPGLAEGWREDFPGSRIVLLTGEEDGDGPEEEDGDGVRCGRGMFAIESVDEFDAVMPDRLHPNAEGYELWAGCIRRGIDRVTRR